VSLLGVVDRPDDAVDGPIGDPEETFSRSAVVRPVARRQRASYCRTAYFASTVLRECVYPEDFTPSSDPTFTYFCPTVSAVPRISRTR
jgi:hypothetical protein